MTVEILDEVLSECLRVPAVVPLTVIGRASVIAAFTLAAMLDRTARDSICAPGRLVEKCEERAVGMGPTFAKCTAEPTPRQPATI